jgi:membrane associated rhomboid family serine protease
MFGHADGEHLLGNMIFLWIFGAALEHRIGPINFLFDYLVMGTVANAIGMTGFALFGEESISLGASGAIAGVMGIYLVRCYFNRIPIGVPILVPMGPTGPLVFAVRFNAVALLTFFFLLDLLGVREQLAGSASPIGYWAHLGGYFCGLSIGYSRRYYRDGLREELAARMQTGPRDGDFGRRRGARDTLLELSPDHPDALLCRARDGSRFQRREDAADDYVRLIHLLLGSDRRRAGTIFLEYFHKYLRPLTLDRQLAVTPELAARGEIDLAARCLDLAAREADADPELRARATAYEAKLLSRLGLLQAPEPQDRATREAPEN